MYFTIGGRRVQSGLYRVSYVGNESTAAATEVATDNPLRQLRHDLEKYHGNPDPAAVDAAWNHLDHKDRFVRFAARTALEHQPLERWQQKALDEKKPAKRIVALLALSRAAGVCPQHRNDETPEVNVALRDRMLASVLQIDASRLSEQQKQTLVRVVQIILNRFGMPETDIVEQLRAGLEPMFPASTAETNWLLCETLAFLQSPVTARVAMDLISRAPTQEEQMQYARSIRMLKAGWTPELRTAYFEWFLKAANYRGGASFAKFIQFIRDDAVASLTDQEKESMAELLARKPKVKSALENLGEVFVGRTATEWTLNDLSDAAKTGLVKRNFTNGKKMFAASGCYACHRFGNQGGMTGPDLTSAGRRYSAHDLLDQVVNPSKVINEQFSAVKVLTLDGVVHTGVIVNLNRDGMTLNTDLTDPNKRVGIDRKEIDLLEVSEVSAMPSGLLNPMTKEEVLDLVAYLLSGGDENHRYFTE